MWFQSRKDKSESPKSLAVTAADGTQLMVCANDVVDRLRYMVSRINRVEPFPARLSLVASLRGEGVTYISRALAATMARDLERTVCAVELNWWWPASPFPGYDTDRSLAAVLAGQTSLSQALVQTAQPNLALLPAGLIPAAERSTVARSSQLQDVIVTLNEQFDHLILDIPAILATNDAIPLASLGTAACFVVHQGATSIETARVALDDVDHIRLLGAVMNQVTLTTPSTLLKFIPQA